MNIFKNILKKTFVYKFFHNHFNVLQNKMAELEDSINAIQHNINTIENILPTFNEKFNVLENRTKQLDYINTELLFLQCNNNKPKILIVGFYGAPNTGDELMLQSILEKIDTRKYSITVMLADNPCYKLENYKNINFIHYPKTNMDINILSCFFDKVIFGGGALIEDVYYASPNAYKHNTAIILIELSLACILNGKKVYSLGLSVSKELNNPSYLSKLDFIIENSEYFSLRDTNSLETLKRAGIKNINKIDIIHDLAFSLKKVCYNFKNLDTSDDFIIGLVLIGFSDIDKLRNILVWLDNYSKNIKKKVKIKLIPFYDYLHSDIVNFNNLINSIKLHHFVEILPYFQQYEDVMETFTQCNLIINMRYHSSLLSLKTGIPSIHIVYDIHPHYENKMNYLKTTFVLADLFLSYKNLTKASLYNCLDYAINNLSQIHLLENSISERIQIEAQEQHTNIINNILEN